MKSVTPGTIVVAVGTVLLILVSVSIPVTKTFFFLSANVAGFPGDVRLGVWGYCAGDRCSNSTLGYSLDVDRLFGVTGLAARSGLPASLIQALTYVLVLHPIAAGFGFLATIFGILSHIREISMVGTTTAFASLGATFALLAFIFDIVLFQIARQRINSAGGSAVLGNAVWMTLVGMLCLMFSGWFFCIGRCCVNKRKAGREASEKHRPAVDPNYGQAMRQEAVTPGGFAHPVTPAPYSGGRKEAGLPMFEDRDGDIIPLKTMRDDDDDDYYDDRNRRPAMGGRNGTDNASLVSGVGIGYGKRSDGGIPVSFSNGSVALANGGGYGGAGGAKGGYLPHSDSNLLTVAPFQSMNNPRPSNLGAPPLTPVDSLSHYGTPTGYADGGNYAYHEPMRGGTPVAGGSGGYDYQPPMQQDYPPPQQQRDYSYGGAAAPVAMGGYDEPRPYQSSLHPALTHQQQSYHSMAASAQNHQALPSPATTYSSHHGNYPPPTSLAPSYFTDQPHQQPQHDYVPPVPQQPTQYSGYAPVPEKQGRY